MLNWYKKLSQVRKQNKALVQGSFAPILEDHPQIFAYKRIADNDTVTVLVNLTETDAVYDVAVVAGAKLMLSNYKDVLLGKMRPLEAVILTF